MCTLQLLRLVAYIKGQMDMLKCQFYQSSYQKDDSIV